MQISGEHTCPATIITTTQKDTFQPSTPTRSRSPRGRRAVNRARDISPSPRDRHAEKASARDSPVARQPVKQGRSLSRPLFRARRQGAAEVPVTAQSGHASGTTSSSPCPPPVVRLRSSSSRASGVVVPSARSPSQLTKAHQQASLLSSPAVVGLACRDKDRSPPSLSSESPSSLSPGSAAQLSPATPAAVGSISGVLRVRNLVPSRASQLLFELATGEETGGSPPAPYFLRENKSSMGNRYSRQQSQSRPDSCQRSANDSALSAGSATATPRRPSGGGGGSGGSTRTTPVAHSIDAKPRPASPQRKEMDAKDREWTFHAPPSSQRTFFFAEDNIEFSSEFDSGNLIQMERLGAYKYNLYTAMDCSNDERQTNNRQWFHFSVRGGAKGSTVSVTVVGLMHCNVYTYEWMPVMAVLPNRPAYVRMPGKAATTALDAVPATPDYPMLAYRDPAERRRALEGLGELDDGGGDGGDAEDGADEDEEGNNNNNNNASSPVGENPAGEKDKGKKKKKKKPVAMNLQFDFRLDYDIPLQSQFPLGHPECPAMYIASNHPYAYTTLQADLLSWQRLAANRAGVSASAMPPTTPPAAASLGKNASPVANLWNYAPNFANGHQHDIYFHREVLCKSLEGRNVDLITITDMSGIHGAAKQSEGDVMPLLTFNGEATPIGFPHSSARKHTTRPRRFAGKQYVVLSARVHAGECPGSHMMRGCLEFLMNPKDPRAMALRRHFVFFLVPMLNPDGVVRGHSRVDANGVDLNRMYRTPSYKRHPAAYGLWALLSTLAAEKRLALYVDMHAHANKRGTFFYANGMDASPQVDNLLYAKLVSLNTPYLEFKSCNYSEANMCAVTRSGLSKDCSCRVVLSTETGVLHSYAVEASYVAGKALNPIAPLTGIPGEEIETVASMRYSPATFNDTGKAMLLGLLDLKGLNPVSRVPVSPYQSVKSIALWIQRQLQIELAEKLFEVAYKAYGRVEPESPSQSVHAAILAKLTPEDIPEKLTVRGCRHLPPTTVSNFKDFIPLELADTLLAQTPPTGPPRSLLCAPQRRKTGSAAAAASTTTAASTAPTTRTSPASAASPVAAAPSSQLYVVGDSSATNRPLPVVAQPISGTPGKSRSGSQRTQDYQTPMDEITAAVREASANR